MTPLRPQLKTGRAVNLKELIIASFTLLSAAVGMYVKNQVAMSKLQDHVEMLEKEAAKNQANVLYFRQIRAGEIKDLDIRVQGNTNDINIIKTQLNYLNRNR